MEKYICIHGHFYQPPRENPWLEEVELQDSAYPYHDWNAKITEECYKQNAASRILSPDKKIIDISNNYSDISFDFGPTLLSWLERHASGVYESVIEADKESQRKFSGHGAAIAQVYNHMIMPLANKRDKETQIVWGISDFEHRFGRKPEGMWLSETAVDTETLDMLAEYGIKFTILAPHQAKRIRKIGDEKWQNIDRSNVDTRRPYVCNLASGKSISLFFYHHPTAQNVADGKILQNGEIFARKLAWILDEHGQSGLAHIATDGETYGHHHRYTDMALAYCLHFIKTNNLSKITIYGEYLEKFPPEYEVEIYENSSWSCSHGVERWRSNCGCNYGRYPSGKQQWREPLREAMDWLRDKLISVYENEMVRYVPDPWKMRNAYISVINNRAVKNIKKFLLEFAGRQLGYGEKVVVLKLLEMQRNAMLMYTSCGWFFDDISGIETVQIMEYAARAIQLTKEIDGNDFEIGFKNILKNAPSNADSYGNGEDIYDGLVKNSNIDLNRVGAHLAVSFVLKKHQREKNIYCYSTHIENYNRIDAGAQLLATGRATIQSDIILERHMMDFAVLYLGDHNLICAANAQLSNEDFQKMRADLKASFSTGNITEVMRIMNVSFKGNHYSLWHLFKDRQRNILYELLNTTWQEIEASFRHIYEHNYTIMQIMRGMDMPLPKALSGPAEFILNHDLCKIIQGGQVDVGQLKRLVAEVKKMSLNLDMTTLRFEASRKINHLTDKFGNSPDNIELLETITSTLGILVGFIPVLDLQSAQNVLFNLSKEKYPVMTQRAGAKEKYAKKWCKLFKSLANYLGVVVD